MWPKKDDPPMDAEVKVSLSSLHNLYSAEGYRLIIIQLNPHLKVVKPSVINHGWLVKGAFSCTVLMGSDFSFLAMTLINNCYCDYHLQM